MQNLLSKFPLHSQFVCRKNSIFHFVKFYNVIKLLIQRDLTQSLRVPEHAPWGTQHR